MGEDAGAGRSAVSTGSDGERTAAGSDAEPDQIREEIEATRQEMGDTVEELAEKTDVKAQAKRKAQETKASVMDKADELRSKATLASPATATSAVSQATDKARQNPVPAAAAGAFLLGVVVGRLRRR
jgi:ElaB/YqjD/DUF883 family membrane-anchored ribosome-binding protein